MEAPATAGDRHGHPETSAFGPHLSHASHSQLATELNHGKEDTTRLASIEEKRENGKANAADPIEAVP